MRETFLTDEAVEEEILRLMASLDELTEVAYDGA